METIMETIKVLEEYYDEANVGGQPNKYLVRKQRALSSAISTLKRIEVGEIGTIVLTNYQNPNSSAQRTANSIVQFLLTGE